MIDETTIVYQDHPDRLAMKAAHVALNQTLANQSLQAKSEGSQYHQVDETTKEGQGIVQATYDQ